MFEAHSAGSRFELCRNASHLALTFSCAFNLTGNDPSDFFGSFEGFQDLDCVNSAIVPRLTQYFSADSCQGKKGVNIYLKGTVTNYCRYALSAIKRKLFNVCLEEFLQMTGANTAKTWIKMRRLGKLENKRHYARIAMDCIKNETKSCFNTKLSVQKLLFCV